MSDILDMPVSYLGLSTRVMTCFRINSNPPIETVRELVRYSDVDLRRLRNFGRTSLREVTKRLSDHGLKLAMQLPTHEVDALRKRVEELESDKVKLWAIARFANHLRNCAVTRMDSNKCNCRYRETWDALPED